MSLNYIQCKRFIEESCDDYSTIELFSDRDLTEATYCMWAALEDCEDYRPLEETANE